MSTNDTEPITSSSFPHTAKFILLMVLQIPSILISLLIFTYFGSKPFNRIKKHIYSILFLLSVNFVQVIIDLPMPMSFFRLNGRVQPATSAYCFWWTWFEFSLNTINGFLMAWISFERHLFIFHHRFLQNLSVRKRRLFHTIPLLICTLWGSAYYGLTILISPMCTNEWLSDVLLCGLPCYLFTSWGTFDLFVDVISPVLVIGICNLALFIRVVYQKMRLNGRARNHGRRQRKLAFQLGFISVVYLTVWIPISIIELGQTYINPNFLGPQLDIFNSLVYIVPLILPLVFLMSMPELTGKIKSFVFRWVHRPIHPLDSALIRRIDTNPRTQARTDIRF